MLPIQQAWNLTRSALLAAPLRVAASREQRRRGLLDDTAATFPAGHGLWISPCHGVHTVGMRFTIDAVYLDREQRVIHVAAQLRPWRVAAIRRRAAGVLELPAGTVARTNTQLGDQLQLGEPA